MKKVTKNCLFEGPPVRCDLFSLLNFGPCISEADCPIEYRPSQHARILIHAEVTGTFELEPTAGSGTRQCRLDVCAGNDSERFWIQSGSPVGFLVGPR